MQDLEERILKIEDRNKKVQLDKKWEGSLTRLATISILSYFFFGFTFTFIGTEKPFLNSFIAVFGFILSTFSFSFIKKRWLLKNK